MQQWTMELALHGGARHSRLEWQVAWGAGGTELWSGWADSSHGPSTIFSSPTAQNKLNPMLILNPFLILLARPSSCNTSAAFMLLSSQTIQKAQQANTTVFSQPRFYVREIFVSGNNMKFLVGPALNNRNYQRRRSGRGQVWWVTFQDMVPWGKCS